MGMESQTDPVQLRETGSADTDPTSTKPTGPGATDDVERLVENDLSLVPSGASRLLVEPAVLDPEEVQALLGGLTALLRSAEATGDFPAEGSPHDLADQLVG